MHTAGIDIRFAQLLRCLEHQLLVSVACIQRQCKAWPLLAISCHFDTHHLKQT